MAWRHVTRTASVSVTLLLLGLGAVAGVAHLQGVRFLSVQSGSMVPAFSKGDLVAVTSIPSSQYAPGDVITFTNPDNPRQTVTHRIQRIIPKGDEYAGKPVRQTSFITKGDANPAADAPIQTRDIVGKVQLSLPLLGSVLDFLRQPLGLLLMIYVPALTIIWSEIRRLITYYRDQIPYTASIYQPTSPEEAQPSPTKQLIKPAATTAIIVTLVIGAIAAPTVRAALIDSADLQDSSASTLSPTPQPLNHPVISKVVFDKTVSTGGGNNNVINITQNINQNATSGNVTGENATSGNVSNTINTSINISIGGNNTPQTQPGSVTIYNPTTTTIIVSGWKLTDNTDSHTLPANTAIAPKSTYTFNWPSASGLNSSSDRLILSNLSNTVDALSWGTDTTQLNPPISTSPVSVGLSRINPDSDTNTSADWAAQ